MKRIWINSKKQEGKDQILHEGDGDKTSFRKDILSFCSRERSICQNSQMVLLPVLKKQRLRSVFKMEGEEEKMSQKPLYAYVGTYTTENSKGNRNAHGVGIYVYEISGPMEDGSWFRKCLH